MSNNFINQIPISNQSDRRHYQLLKEVCELWVGRVDWLVSLCVSKPSTANLNRISLGVLDQDISTKPARP
jgi:hypothetical protein